MPDVAFHSPMTLRGDATAATALYDEGRAEPTTSVEVNVRGAEAVVSAPSRGMTTGRISNETEEWMDSVHLRDLEETLDEILHSIVQSKSSVNSLWPRLPIASGKR